MAIVHAQSAESIPLPPIELAEKAPYRPTRHLKRKLVAILAADIVDFTALMARNEDEVFQNLQSWFNKIVTPAVKEHKGRVVKTLGDGFIAEFTSAETAVRCAIAIQSCRPSISHSYRSTPFQVRIGIHYGKVIAIRSDILGKCVNMAHRLQMAACPGGIYISNTVYNYIESIGDIQIRKLGHLSMRHVSEHYEVFSVLLSENPYKYLQDLLPKLSIHPHPNCPILVTLPLRYLGDGTDPTQMAFRVWQDVHDKLGAYRWFRVVSQQGFDTTSETLSIRADYSLHAELVSTMPFVEISVRLTEVVTGFQAWSSRFKTRNLRDREELAIRIAASVESELQEAETHRAVNMPPGTNDIYLHSQLGHAYYLKRTRECNTKALAIFRECREHMRHYAPALIGEAAALFWAAQRRWSSQPEIDLQQAFRFSVDALDFAPRMPLARLVLAQSLLFLGRHGEAIREAKHAAALNPSNPAIFAFLGHAHTAMGKFDLGVKAVKHALYLAPYHSNRSIWLSNLALAHYHKGQLNAAMRAASEATAAAPDHWVANQVMVAALGRLGRVHEAVSYVAASRAVEPETTSETFAARFPYLHWEHLHAVRDDLRAGGWDG